MSSGGRHGHKSGRRRAKPRRKASSSSRSHARRQRSHDRHPEASSPVGIPDRSDRPGDGFDIDPPDYETSQAQNASVAQAPSGKEESTSAGVMSGNSVQMRIIWGLILGLPLLVAMALLLLITCSSTQLRVDFNVLKFPISPNTFQGLSQIVKDQPSSEGSSLLAEAASLGGNIRKRQGEAYMTLGVWGWCAKTADAQQIACSPASAWFSLKDTLGARNFADLPVDAFSPFLVHALILHGLALLANMLALVPTGLFIYRRYYQNDRKVESGWFQHGTILAACLLALSAWICDKLLVKRASSRMNNNTIYAGPVNTIVGTAAICLLVSFLISVLPVLSRYIRFKYQYACHWQNLEEVSLETNGDTQESKIQSETVNSTRRKPRRGRGRFRERMTKMFY